MKQKYKALAKRLEEVAFQQQRYAPQEIEIYWGSLECENEDREKMEGLF